jgi:predicted CXXCH cytochrome family protein
MLFCALLLCLAEARGYNRPPFGYEEAADLASCVECHDRAEDGTMSLKPERECASCHEQIVSQMGTAEYVHPALRADQGRAALCLDCHRFHDAKDKLLPDDPIQTCLACHPASGGEGSHPVGVPNFRSGREITCTSDCHDPHGSANRWICRMEPGHALCISCHEGFR